MELTETEKILIRGLMVFPLEEDTQEAIFLALRKESQQKMMIRYLVNHKKADEQEILKAFGMIMRKTS